MRKMNENNFNLQEKILITIDDLQNYASLGRNAAYKLARESGASVRIGRRVLINKKKLDIYLDGITG